MMLNNTIEVTFYMESNDYINMKEIDKILNIKNAEFYSTREIYLPHQTKRFNLFIWVRNRVKNHSL